MTTKKILIHNVLTLFPLVFVHDAVAVHGEKEAPKVVQNLLAQLNVILATSAHITHLKQR